jgi:cytochrome c oxidase subunit 2
MNVALYEKVWMWAAGGLIAAFLVTLVAGLAGSSLQPPSHVETIDPTAVDQDPRFAQPGVSEGPGGTTVIVVSSMYAFTPAELRVPANRPVTFRMTSRDVVHGFQIVGTNGNAMVVPGYISQFTTTFREPGEYLIVCNEYCGTGHHMMHAVINVEARP